MGREMKETYKQRNRVERAFGKAKQFRRFATRYEKLRESSSGWCGWSSDSSTSKRSLYPSTRPSPHSFPFPGAIAGIVGEFFTSGPRFSSRLSRGHEVAVSDPTGFRERVEAGEQRSGPTIRPDGTRGSRRVEGPGRDNAQRGVRDARRG